MEFRRASGKRLGAEALMNYAVRVLGRRALSTSELKRKLETKAESSADIEPILNRLKESKLIDDPQFAEAFATRQRDGRNFGAQRVRRDLALRQVPRAVAETAVQKAFEDSDETGLALVHLERKLRSPGAKEQLSDPKNLQSAYRKLRYAGFSATAAVAALRRFSSRAEELEDPVEE